MSEEDVLKEWLAGQKEMEEAMTQHLSDWAEEEAERAVLIRYQMELEMAEEIEAEREMIQQMERHQLELMALEQKEEEDGIVWMEMFCFQCNDNYNGINSDNCIVCGGPFVCPQNNVFEFFQTITEVKTCRYP